jgi:hypothetical protein
MLKISAEILFELEESLSHPYFYGVSVGSTLGDIYNIELYQGQGQWGIKASCLQYLKKYYFRLLGQPHTGGYLTADTGKYLITWLGEKDSLKGLVFPLLGSLGSNQCNVIGSASTMRAQLPPETGFMTWEQTPTLNLYEWRKEYDRCSPVWERTIRNVLNRHKISLKIVPRIMVAILAQTQRIMMYGTLLDKLCPRVIITEFDRNIHSSCLILAASVRGIPTVTMLHGVINPPYGYTPILADYIFCWGEQSRQQLVLLGVPEEKIRITGCQRLTRFLDATPAASRLKIGISDGKTAVLLATSPIAAENRKKLVRDFCTALSEHENICAVVRLHPSEQLNFYRDEVLEYTQVIFMGSRDCSLDEAIAAVDVVVCHDSGFGNDAMVKGKPVIIFDVLPLVLGNGKDMIELGGCPRITSSVELSGCINRILFDEVYRNELEICRERYVRFFCSSFGDDAAHRTALLISDIEKHIPANMNG